MKEIEPSRNTVFIGLGANLGKAKEAVLKAARMIFSDCQAVNPRESSLYLTAPIDSSGPDYVNMVIAFETAMDDAAVFEVLQKVEAFFWERTARGHCQPLGPMDCDFLLFNVSTDQSSGADCSASENAQRAFVLAPLLEIAPNISIPGKGKAKEFLKNTQDQEIQKLEEENGESN